MDLISLLQYLVSIPSINPAFAKSNDDLSYFGEKRYAESISEELRQIGCQVWLEEVLPDRPNVMARLPGSVGHRSIALQSHLDTVQVTGMTVSPWGRLEGNKLYGRGSSDPKASTVAQIAALKYIAEAKNIASDIYFIGTVDEEVSFKGALQVAENYKFDACIVGEPTDLTPIVAHKGAVRFELVTEGVACHSSNPALGRNAILEMMALLEALREPFTEYTTAQIHPLTGPATWAPTLIEGGTGLNTIPPLCSLAIDRRLVPGETAEQVLDFIGNWLAKQQGKGHPWHQGKVYIVDPPLEPDLDSDVLKALQEALGIFGLDPKPRGVSYGTDASKIALSGTPCVVFGPGSIAQAHSADEWIDVSAIGQAAKVITTTIEILDKKWRDMPVD